MASELSPRLAEIVAALPLRRDSRVLEIGCGPGSAARAVAARVDAGHVVAIDRSPAAIAAARRACTAEIAAGRLSLREVAAEDFVLEPGEAPFDLVFAVRVGALDGRRPAAGARARARIAAALAPGGRVLVDGGAPLRELVDLVPASDPLGLLRERCLRLPEVSERLSHGEPAWFVRGKKTFVAFADHHHDDRLAFWCAAAPGVAAELIAAEPDRFFRPPYVGGRGWLGVRLDRDVDWAEIGEIVTDAYRAVASASLRARLDTAHTRDLLDRIRDALASGPPVREVTMFGGVSFMVNDKMVVSARSDGDLLVRCDPDRADELLKISGAAPAEMGAGRAMNGGWISVSREAIATDDDLGFWIGAALEHNAKKPPRRRRQEDE